MKPLLLSLCLVAAMPAMAAPVCNPDGSQLELNQCAAEELAEADAELNTVYRQVVASRNGDPVALDRLRAAQRLWIQLRDADLAAQFPLAEGQDPRLAYGSIYPLEFAAEKAELTRQRSAYLRRQFLGQGDTGR
ncbi:DUF1311 domain-containing protein [Luteimonas sp. BDR2-5]|uniref:lysozyme inhibitor LprI family protein n=1 Tax=Proluteimonas luteida TaxID=2878685 RepID=UPI001E63B532|nr:lysozyme inhibitor LprI family protein [Luteimonas sp. BDR2-5]MCD9028174.1 DUF1311 domain-containing protein [Luteimonas sp. BDR2-5]